MTNDNASPYVFVEESWCLDTVAVRAGMRSVWLTATTQAASAVESVPDYERALGDVEHGFAVAYRDADDAVRALASTAGRDGPHLAVQQLSDIVKAALVAAARNDGIDLLWVDAADGLEIARLLPQVSAIWVEAIPSGPAAVPALFELAQDCRQLGVSLIVDGTHSTPSEHECLQDGADALIYGHAGIIAADPGLALASVIVVDAEVQGRLLERRNGHEAPLPGAARRASIGLRTLPARLDRSARSAAVLTARLGADPRVAAVWLRALRWGESEDLACSDETDTPTSQLCLVLPRASAGSLMQHLPSSWRSDGADGVATHIRWVPTGATARWLGIDGRYLIRVGTECLADLWDELDAALTAALK